MAERDRSKVTVTLTESEARWLLGRMTLALSRQPEPQRIVAEIKHALAECDCSESKT